MEKISKSNLLSEPKKIYCDEKIVFRHEKEDDLMKSNFINRKQKLINKENAKIAK